MNKRILFVANYSKGLGGISGQVEYLVRYLSKEPLFSVEVFSTKGSLLKRFMRFFSLMRVAREYDVLHIHGCSFRGFLPVVFGVVAGKVCHKKLVVTYHGGDASAFFSKHPRWVKFWLMKADKRVVLSGFLKAVFDQYSIPAFIIPNVVELDDGLYVEKEAIRPRFISVRHLRELYNIPCILKAFEKVQNHIPEAALTILGDGDKRKELEQYVKDRNLKNVTFVGQVPNDAIGTYLKANDIMLSSPRVDNMPVSLLEAFSAGLLVISSNVGGVPFMINHGNTGLLFDSDDDAALAEAMLWAVSRQKESLQMIRNAKKEVGAYSWSSIREKTLELYE